MKRWLGAGFLATLGIVASVAAAQTSARSTGAMAHKLLLPDQLKWGAPPPGLPPAAQAAVLDGDPTKPGIFTVRLHAPDGYQIRPHWHSQDEHITVISGKFAMGMGDHWTPSEMHEGGPGAFMSLPSGQRHSAVMRGDTIIQISGFGPFDIFYVDPNDDPRQKRSAR
jgi:quercetin dioxygenase-like cupin family protein